MKLFFIVFTIFLVMVILFAGIPTLINGFPYHSGSQKAGVFKSSDSGSSWDLKANTNVAVRTSTSANNTSLRDRSNFGEAETRRKIGNRQVATIGVAIDKNVDRMEFSSGRSNTEISNTNTAFKKEIFDIALDPQNSKNVYLGTKGAGLVIASDSGETWVPVIDSTKELDPKANINKVLINPKDHGIIYLVVFQKNYGMILRSKNSGYSFETIYITAGIGQEITALAANPADPDLIYFGTSNGGLFESNNAGDSWRVLRWFNSAINVILQSKNSFFIGTSSGLFKTTDRGRTFLELNKKLSKLDNNASHIFAMSIDRVNPNIIYLGTKYGLLRSKNSGSSFSLVNGLMPVNSLPIGAIEISPIDGKIIYVGAGAFIYKSIDGGLYWSVEKLPTPLNVRVIKINPNSPKEIYLGVAE
ncbi:hypothetical protein HY061_02795 [Candidatus Azambacteria bacterium]|nr:hypothetical protein [Candidatus Azambacteria bacterium]